MLQVRRTPVKKDKPVVQAKHKLEDKSRVHEVRKIGEVEEVEDGFNKFCQKIQGLIKKIMGTK